MTTSSRKGEGAASAAPLPQLADQIRSELEAAEQGHREALGHAIRAGQLLIQAKTQMQHGEWLPWLEKNFPGHHNTANSYMLLARNSVRVGNLGSVRDALAAVRKPRETGSAPRERMRNKNTTPAESVERLRGRVRQVLSLDSRVRPRWTLEDVDDVQVVLAMKRSKSPTGKRLHQVGTKRAAARRAGDPVVLWDTAYEITKLTGLLESLEVEDVELDEHTLDTLNDLLDDVLRMQEWMDRTTSALQARLGEHGIRQKIVALRAKTIANGCTADEVTAAQRAADRLERRLAARLGIVAV